MLRQMHFSSRNLSKFYEKIMFFRPRNSSSRRFLGLENTPRHVVIQRKYEWWAFEIFKGGDFREILGILEAFFWPYAPFKKTAILEPFLLILSLNLPKISHTMYGERSRKLFSWLLRCQNNFKSQLAL